MAQRLAEIYESNINAFLSMFSFSVLVFLQMIFEKQLNGNIPARDLGNDARYAALAELYSQLEYLGLIDYKGGNIFVAGILEGVIPSNFKFIEQQLNRWQEMEDCACGILLAYGILEKQTFYRMFGSCYPNLSKDEVSTFLSRRIAVLGASDYLNVGRELWIFSELVDDPEGWYLAMKGRGDIPYRKYTREDFIRVNKTGLIKRPKNYEKLISIFHEKGMSNRKAEDVLFSAVIHHCCELDIDLGVPEYIKEIAWNNIDEVQQVLDLYREFQNDTPIWYNKGNTPNEVRTLFSPIKINPRDNWPYAKDLSGIPGINASIKKDNVLPFPSTSISDKKAGRNDPCPCGSGKKYKNCCGSINADD